MKSRFAKQTLSTLGLIGVLGMSLSTPALARGGRHADTDGDGVVSQAEFQAKALKRFERMDADGDGVITQADVTAKSQERFNKLDANQDGVISSDEFRSHRRHRGRGPGPQS